MSNAVVRKIGKCSTVTIGKANMRMIRLYFEYASSAWDPYQNSHIHKVIVQSRAIIFVLNQCDLLASISHNIWNVNITNLQVQCKNCHVLQRTHSATTRRTFYIWEDSYPIPSLMYLCIHDRINNRQISMVFKSINGPSIYLI